MSTIERALEKQQQLEQQKRQQDELQATNSTANNAKPIELDSTKPISPESQADTEPASFTDDQPHHKAPTTGPHNEKIDRPEQQVTIDTQHLEALGMVSPNVSFSQIKEEYRYIKRPLLNNAFGPGASTLKQPNLVMISSSFPGEGKTFTAVNLAISITMEEDRKVLLVDADVIRPNVCERLGIQPQTGLMDYLTGKAEVADIIFNSNIPNLKLITAGRRHHHANEMIASEKMKRFMAELSIRYPDRIVIFDTSPLLGASETNVLAQMTGQAVIVVEEERTTHPQLQQALSLLDPDMAVGLVLNKSKSRSREYYGYYYARS